MGRGLLRRQRNHRNLQASTDGFGNIPHRDAFFGHRMILRACCMLLQRKSVKSGDSLIGDKFLSLSPGSNSEMISPGGIIVETESAIDLESLLSRFAFGSVQAKAETRAK